MKVPPVGFGTSPYRSGRRVDIAPAVREAARLGHRLFDVAEMYGNEAEVGAALRGSSVFRSGALMVVGKAWRTHHRPEALRRACEGSLRRLGVDAFEFYLLHSPQPWRDGGELAGWKALGEKEFRRRALPVDADGSPLLDDVKLAETWDAMQELVARGIVRRAGLCNVDDETVRSLSPPPAAIQNVSPLSAEAGEVAPPPGVVGFAHSPLSSSTALGSPAVLRIAGAHGVSPAAILLAWHRARGWIPITSSVRTERIAQGLLSVDLALGGADLKMIDAQLRKRTRSPAAGNAPT